MDRLTSKLVTFVWGQILTSLKKQTYLLTSESIDYDIVIFYSIGPWSTRVGSGLALKHLTSLENLNKDKHSCLFDPFAGYED